MGKEFYWGVRDGPTNSFPSASLEIFGKSWFHVCPQMGYLRDLHFTSFSHAGPTQRTTAYEKQNSITKCALHGRNFAHALASLAPVRLVRMITRVPL